MHIQARDRSIAATADAVVIVGRRTRCRQPLGRRIAPHLVAFAVLGMALLGMPALISAQPPEPAGSAAAEAEAAQVPAEALAPEDRRERVEQAIDEALDELENRLDELEDAVDESEERTEDLDRRLERRRDDLRRAREDVRRRVRGSVRSRGGDQKISFGSDVRLEDGDIASDLIAILGSVYAEGDVQGDVVAVGGSAHIDGRVTGDVIAVGGRVVLGPEAEVFGDITSVGGRIEKHENATVHGSENEVSFGDGISIDPFRWDFDHFDHNWLRIGNAFEFGWGVIALGLLLLMVCLVQLVAGDAVRRVGAKAASAPWASILAGFLVWVLTFPVFLIVFVILCVSIIGIPVALLLALGTPIVFFVGSLVGFTGLALVAGQWLEKRFGWKLGGPILALIVGVVAIQALSLLGDLISITGFLGPFAWMFSLCGFFLKLMTWMAGLGAVVLTAFGKKAPSAPIESSAAPVASTLGGEGAPPAPPEAPSLPPATTAGDDEPEAQTAEDAEPKEPES